MAKFAIRTRDAAWIARNKGVTGSDGRTTFTVPAAKVERGPALAYGIPSEKGRKDYEAWLRFQPTRDLREMLADDEIDADSAAFIRQAIEDRRSPSRDDD
jgi:hypothetical protein